MDADDVRALADQFDKGAAIPAVQPAELKEMWEAVRRMEAEFGSRPDHATGLGALGFDLSSRRLGFAVEAYVIGLRQSLLATLVERGVLRDYQHGDELDELVFRAAATVPFKQEDLYVAIMAVKLVEAPADVMAQVKKDFREHGYDLDRPAIEGRFLAWMRDSC